MSEGLGTHVNRAFVAVVPPPAVLDAIESRVEPLASSDDSLRWSWREQWHVTLRFLGRVTDVDDVVDAVRTVALSTPTFALQLRGAGAFRRDAKGTEFWVGIREGAVALTRLATELEDAAVDTGYEPESRAFAPHLTLARANRPRDLRPLIAAFGNAPVGPTWIVDEIVLLASDTRPSGAVYGEVDRLTLRK